MALTIYGTARSRAARVLWMAKELGLEFEHIPLAMGDPAMKQPAYLKINPAGRVPAIDDNGFTLSESLAINLYLARKFGERANPSLAPASLEEEARIWQWSSWAMTDLETQLNIVHLHRNFFPPEKRDTRAAENAEAQVQRPLAMLDSVLAGGAYLLGSRFSVATSTWPACCPRHACRRSTWRPFRMWRTGPSGATSGRPPRRSRRCDRSPAFR